MLSNKKKDNNKFALVLLGHKINIPISDNTQETERYLGIEKYINNKFESLKKFKKVDKANNQHMLTILINVANELLEERKKTQHLKQEILLIVEEMEKKMNLLS